MLWITLMAIYTVIAIVFYCFMPYRNDVPKTDLLTVSVFWLPVFIITLLIGLFGK